MEIKVQQFKDLNVFLFSFKFKAPLFGKENQFSFQDGIKYNILLLCYRAVVE